LEWNLDLDRAISLGSHGPRVGYFRIGVYWDNWDRIVKVLESGFGSVCYEMTRRELVLADDKDSTTGWFNYSFTDSTFKGILVSKSATRLQVAAGAYVRHDASLLTPDPIVVGDQIKTKEDEYYKVLAVTEEMVGDSFSHRVCDLAKIPLYEEG